MVYVWSKIRGLFVGCGDNEFSVNESRCGELVELISWFDWIVCSKKKSGGGGRCDGGPDASCSLNESSGNIWSSLSSKIMVWFVPLAITSAITYELIWI